LWDTSFEPGWHREEAGELSEDHLLAGLGGNGLVEELSNLARIEMGLETPHSGLTEAGELLCEVQCFMDGGEWVVICA
jgi:hypothetical protein